MIFHGKFRRQSGGRTGLDSASQSFRECWDILASDTNESYDVWCAEYPLKIQIFVMRQSIQCGYPFHKLAKAVWK